MGWRTNISREASSSLPAVGLGLGRTTSPSKLKLPNAAPLPQLNKTTPTATLTSVGRAVQSTTQIATRVYAAPRLIAHAGVIALVGAIVLTGSTGHSARLNPLADQVGFGSVLDQGAATAVAAKVADQTGLLVTPEVDSSAQTLNAQVSLPTSDDGTLAPSDVVNTSGAAVRGVTAYTVQPGDTVASIAGTFGVTSDTILWSNNLGANGALAPGQKLTILPISGVQYVVKAGDTAQSIAAHFQANPDQIVAFNNDEVSGIVVGQSIVVPDGVLPNVVSAPVAAAPAAPASVKAGSAVNVTPGGANGYAFGYCTWYVAQRRAVPGWWGNANAWYSNAQISGYSVGSTPRVGAIAWSGAGYDGHVAYVESVSGGSVTVSEMNWNGGWDRVDFRTVSASSFRYIY